MTGPRPTFNRFLLMLVCLSACSLACNLSGQFATPTPTATARPAPTTVPTTLPTATREPSATPIIIPTAAPTNTPTITPTLTRTPTLTPTITLTPVPDAHVNIETLNMRAGPGTDFDIQDKLSLGMPLLIIGRVADNTWFEVKTPTGMTGWIMATYIDLAMDPNVRPITHTQPTAAPTAVVAAPPIPNPPISGITATSREIFLRGQQMGNRANVFSKVGDSISISTEFLHPAGDGVYNLGAYSHLAPVIEHFRSGQLRTGNSFNNHSIATFNGWTVGHVLRPGEIPPHAWGDGICNEGESALACELRLSKPAVAVIMFGTNDVVMMSLGEYRLKLAQLVETCINRGVIPILSTIPYRGGFEGDVIAYNEAIRGTARQYDIPLMDYFQLMEPLPNHGLHGDNVHPSGPGGWAELVTFTPEYLQYGYPVRNLLTIQALDAVWRQAMQ